MTAAPESHDHQAVFSESRAVHYITAAALAARLQQDNAPVLLDVRREEGYALQPYQLPGALRFSLDTRPPSVPALPRSTPIVVY